MSAPIRNVVIVGRDAPVWLTALAIQRIVGATGVRVSVVELPPHDEPVDVITTLPTHRALHDLIGLKEETVIGKLGAVYAFAQRYAGWSRDGQPFMQAYDGHGISLYSIPFLNFWVKARANGLDVPLEDFSLGAVAAKQARFTELTDETAPFSHISYGYHLEAVPYAEFLREQAIRVGVRTIASEISAVHTHDGRITSVEMPNGQSADGELFIDVSGRDALLLREVNEQEDAGFVSWSNWLPANRTLALSGPRLNPLPGFAQIGSFRGGWVGLYPLQGRTAALAYYNTQEMSDEEAVTQLPAIAGQPLAGDALAAPFEAGYRPQPWQSNCVAIGEAAVSLEGLDSVPMGIVQAGISHLTSLFPVHGDHMPEASVYNGLMSEQAERMRDFQIAHYALNRRTGEAYWDRARTMSLPEVLQYKIDLFTSRGAIPMFDGEPFDQSNWASCFVGHGLIPQAYDPRVDFVSDAEQIDTFQQLLKTIAKEVKSSPRIEDQISLYAAPPSPFG